MQNRFYARTQFDGPVRRFCLANGIVYQAFWTLSANPRLVASGPVAQLAAMTKVSREVAFYCLVMGLQDGMVVLNGTTDGGRMKADMEGREVVRRWREEGENGRVWESLMEGFRGEMEKESGRGG